MQFLVLVRGEIEYSIWSLSGSESPSDQQGKAGEGRPKPMRSDKQETSRQ